MGGRISRLEALLVLGSLTGVACSTLPALAPALIAIEKNPKAIVSGVVVDFESGEPVEGIEVFGLPRGKDIPWEPAATTDAAGSFTLRLAAPGEYSFLLRFRGISIVTPETGDPGYVDVVVLPAGRIDGVCLKFLRREFEESVP